MSPIKIIRWVALAIAVIAAFVTIPYVALLFIALGLAAGFMGVSSDERILYLVFAIVLAQVAGALGPIPQVGGYLSDILGNLSTIVNAAALAVILTMFKERLMD